MPQGMPFHEVIASRGHRRVVDLLRRSISRGTLPPSLIFAGPPGAGKRDTAIAVAQVLNCLNPNVNPEDLPNGLNSLSVDACGECAACTRIARGVHPDVLIVEPGDTATIRIDQVRDVIDRAGYRPFEGKRRVVIIDDADVMVAAAQNALLKTLEEPPSSSVFILLSARPDMLLPTVRSRCIRLLFADRGRQAIDPEAAAVAQRVLAQVAAAPDSKKLDAARELLAGTGGSATSDREQVSAHLEAMAALVRDIEAVSTRAADADLANPDLRPALERLAPVYRGTRGVEAFAAIGEALDAIGRNVGVKIVADWLVLQL